MMKFIMMLNWIGVLLFSCNAQKPMSAPIAEEKPIAFIGAEGFGKYTTGGRGGKVLIVSNLQDDGEGSLRKAVKAKDPRIVVFSISGTIHLLSPLKFGSNLTIAGQSAPGDGICIADHPVSLNGDNIIIRFLRFRMGDKNQKGGMVDGNGGDDAFGGTRRKNIIIDHCSLSWSTDEVFSIYGGDSTTLQWNLIAEPLNYSYHFETGDKDYEHHGYGAIWGGRHSSFHHNLFAHCNSRTPRFDGIRNIPEENCDYRNNVIYNWGGNNVYAGEGGNYNIVNNYYKPGPETKTTVSKRITNPFSRPPDIGFGKYFVEGNYVDGSPEVTQDNWSGVTMDKGTREDAVKAKLEKPVASVEIPRQSAADAYNMVLKMVGAIMPKRDTMDERIINDVKNRTGKFVDVQGGFPHGTEYELTVNAWPGLKSFPAAQDTDMDGIPDAWEKAKGLNPNDASDAAGYTFEKRWTNIEVYLESLIRF